MAKFIVHDYSTPFAVTWHPNLALNPDAVAYIEFGSPLQIHRIRNVFQYDKAQSTQSGVCPDTALEHRIFRDLRI